MSRAESQRPWREHLIGLFVLVHLALLVIVAWGRAPEDHLAAPIWNPIQRPVDRFVYRTYGALLGPKQYWSMFSGVRTKSTRVQIRVESRKGRETIYLERSKTATWRRATFDHYRWREWLNILGRKPKGQHMKDFAAWVAAEVAKEDPDACRVWIRVLEGEALPPEKLRARETPLFDVVARIPAKIPGRACR